MNWWSYIILIIAVRFSWGTCQCRTDSGCGIMRLSPPGVSTLQLVCGARFAVCDITCRRRCRSDGDAQVPVPTRHRGTWHVWASSYSRPVQQGSRVVSTSTSRCELFTASSRRRVSISGDGTKTVLSLKAFSLPWQWPLTPRRLSQRSSEAHSYDECELINRQWSSQELAWVPEVTTCCQSLSVALMTWTLAISDQQKTLSWSCQLVSGPRLRQHLQDQHQETQTETAPSRPTPRDPDWDSTFKTTNKRPRPHFQD